MYWKINKVFRIKSHKFSYCLNEIYQKLTNPGMENKVIQTKYLKTHNYILEIFKASKN